MALTSDEVTVIQGILTRVGKDQLNQDIHSVVVAARKASRHTGVSSAISVTVSNWGAITTLVADPASDTVISVLADIDAAVGSTSASSLGPLFVQLYAATKAFFGV